MLIAAIKLQSIVRIVTLHTFFLSALMSLGMLLSGRKTAKNQVFFGLFLSFSLIIFYFFLYDSNLVERYPYLSVLCLPGIFLIGPMIYFLAQYSTDKSFKFTRKQNIHILPSIFSLLFGLLTIKLYGYHHTDIYFDFFGNEILLITGFLGFLSFLFYLIFTGVLLIKNYLWNFSTIFREPSALASFILFDIFFLGFITDSLAYLTKNYIFLMISALLLSVCVILLFLVNLIYPGFNVVLSSVVEKEKHKRSYLSTINVEKLKNKINHLIKEEVFKDEHFTLEKLAILAGVSSHQLSEYINEYYHKNFATFINEFRIEKAKKLILEKPEYTILAIAYEVGFNSKSAFNDAFRKITGHTPSEFKKSKNLS